MQAKPEILHDECIQMAHALEGLAGSLHAGHPVAVDDMRKAANAAHAIWEAGPEPDELHRREFQVARHALLRAADASSRGDAKELAVVERNAHIVAEDLRWMAVESAHRARRAAAPIEVERTIARLAAVYGRFGIRAAA